jgi:hypothetical protein
MDVDRLQDRLHWGLNRAANMMGRMTDAYRPIGVSDPLDRSNRYLQLRAAFSRADGNFGRAIGYGVAIWRGIFDASYTRVGDYLVQDHDIWFIAEQQCLLPILCVRTNRVISITRQITPSTETSPNTVNANSMITVISQWPASVLGTGAEGKSPTGLPGDTTIAKSIALVPSVHGQIVLPTDIVTDDLGINSVVVAAELTSLGWRLIVRQVTT